MVKGSYLMLILKEVSLKRCCVSRDLKEGREGTTQVSLKAYPRQREQQRVLGSYGETKETAAPGAESKGRVSYVPYQRVNWGTMRDEVGERPEHIRTGSHPAW